MSGMIEKLKSAIKKMMKRSVKEAIETKQEQSISFEPTLWRRLPKGGSFHNSNHSQYKTSSSDINKPHENKESINSNQSDLSSPMYWILNNE